MCHLYIDSCCWSNTDWPWVFTTTLYVHWPWHITIFLRQLTTYTAYISESDSDISHGIPITYDLTCALTLNSRLGIGITDNYNVPSVVCWIHWPWPFTRQRNGLYVHWHWQIASMYICTDLDLLLWYLGSILLSCKHLMFSRRSTSQSSLTSKSQHLKG